MGACSRSGGTGEGFWPLRIFGQAQLVVGDGDAAALGLARQQLDLDDLGRDRAAEMEPVCPAPSDDIDLLAVQLLDDLLHAGAAGTNEGADGANVGILVPDSQLGAGTSLAGDGLDLDGAVVDLGNFQLKYALDQAGMGCA